MKIDYLKNNLRYASRLAEFCAHQWQHLYLDWDRGAALQEFKSQRNDGTLPLSLIAIQNEELVGMVSLIFDDLPRYEHLNPVAGQSLGLARTQQKGCWRSSGPRSGTTPSPQRDSPTYLFTESFRAFFQQLGWIFVESGVCNHHPIVILTKEFASNKPTA